MAPRNGSMLNIPATLSHWGKAAYGRCGRGEMDNRFQRASDGALDELHSLYKVPCSYNQSPSIQKQKS